MGVPAIVPPVPWQEVELESFRGQWSRPEPTDVPEGQALLALNVEFNAGPAGVSVGTRNGFGVLYNANKIITSLFNWIKAADGVSATGNYLFLYNKTDHKVQMIFNLASPSLYDLFSITADSVDTASSGNQIFLPTVNATNQMTPVGAGQCRIMGINVSAIDVDKAFLGPMTNKPSLSNTGTGSVTQGLHFIGYIVVTRNGYTGKISPIASGTGGVDLTSSINATGGQQISISLTATFPVEAAQLYWVMTATTNQYQYFAVPGVNGGGPYTILGGLSNTINAVIDISDANLIANAQDITANQFFLTQDGSGNGPFSPFKVINYGSRTVYLTYDELGIPSAYVSDPDNPQQLTEQFHKLHLPGFMKMISGFVVNQIVYILGTNWTYSFQDTGGQPVTWPPAALVHGTIGTPCTMGAVATASGDWAAVAHITGLYIFNGQYQELPLSYMIDDQWRKINWAAAQTIRVVDNRDKKQILVVAPLGAATTATNIFVFDYSEGLDYRSIMASVWDVSSYGPSAICVAQNNATARMETLLGPSVAGPILRQMNTTDDASTWAFDQSAGIDFQYEIAPLPTGSIGALWCFIGQYLRALGKGIPRITSYSIDRTIAQQWSKPVVLGTAPGVEYWRQIPGPLRSERASTRYVSGIQPGDWIVISGISQMYFPWARRR